MPVIHFGEYIMELEKNMKLVVLIDADNASADIIEPLLEEIAKYGVASVKRIYGDWSKRRVGNSLPTRFNAMLTSRFPFFQAA